ncbi:MAG: hypothetical protein GXO92_08250 [FCB group bacterium]|nr:hypothetical protein [FCB group bacterium]
MRRNIKHKAPRLFLWLSLIVTCAWLACKTPVGLEPVAGVEGTLITVGAWPDSLRGIVVAALDSLDLEAPARHLIDYSEVLTPPQDTLNFFIQLYHGAFVLVPVGITIDPAFFVANLDSILGAPSLPLVPLVDPANPLLTIRSVGVGEQSVTTVDQPIILDFSR